MKVLIIEPDYLLAETYKKAFEKSNIKVEIAYEAQDAIKKIDKKRPDCVVMELQLAGHSGTEFLHEFRSYDDWQNLPLYIYSNIPEQSFSKSKKLLTSLGVKRYFYKAKTPLNLLIGTIQSDFSDEYAG